MYTMDFLSEINNLILSYLILYCYTCIYLLCVLLNICTLKKIWFMIIRSVKLYKLLILCYRDLTKTGISLPRL